MSKLNSLTWSISAAAILAGTPALADITAAELWETWQANGALMNQAVTAASVEPTSDGLVLRGLSAVTEQDDAVTTTRVDEVRLTEQGDGSIDIAVSDLYTLTTTFPEDREFPGGNRITVEMELRHDGLEVTASGAVGDVIYDYSADRITITDGNISDSDGTTPDVEISVTMTDLAARYAVSGTGEASTFDSTTQLGSLTMTVDAAPPPEDSPDGQFKLALAMSGIASTGGGTLNGIAELAQMSDGLPDGFRIAGNASYDALSYELSFNDGPDTFANSYTNTGGALDVTLSDAGIGYDLSARNTRIQMTGSEIPVPIDISADSGGISFLIPVTASDAPADMAVGIDYQGLTMNEAIWSMFDPGGVIPRDPAAFVLDMTGTVQLFVDLLDMDPAEMTGPPGELRSITLQNARLAVGGAELTAMGDITFTPGQLVPMPVGQVNLTLSGANTLLDRMVQGGMLPAEQAAMARGMSGMFARPGAGPDTLESTIDFTPGGGITANGFPLR